MIYKLQIGDFNDFDKTQLLPGMQLIHYFPLYMHETDSAIIPDMVQSPLQNHLSLSTSALDQNYEFIQEMLEQSILKTLDPNIEQRFLSFSMKGEDILHDVPFLDRSFFIRFDIISCSDSKDVIETTFSLFEYNLRNDANSEINSVRIECKIKFNKNDLYKKSFYDGTLTLYAEKNNKKGEFTKKEIATYPVSVSSSDNSLDNVYSGEEYLKTKYKKGGFYYVLKPQGLLLNVSHFINIFIYF
jgi:hypothetical protein